MISKIFFEQVCSNEFGFLPSKFGFMQKTVAPEQGLWKASYVSLLVQVNIIFELLDQYIDVELECFINGKEGQTYEERQASSFFLSNLLAVRTPSIYFFPPGPTGRVLSEMEVAEILTEASRALEEYAPDILQGDFSVLPQVKSYIQSMN